MIRRALALAMLCALALSTAACGFGGPLDINEILPCNENPATDFTFAAEVADNSGTLKHGDVTIIVDAIGTKGELALNHPTPGEFKRQAPVCWDINLLPGVVGAHVTFTASYDATEPGDLLSCYYFDGHNGESAHSHRTAKSSAVMKEHLSVTCLADVVPRDTN